MSVPEKMVLLPPSYRDAMGIPSRQKVIDSPSTPIACPVRDQQCQYPNPDRFALDDIDVHQDEHELRAALRDLNFGVGTPTRTYSPAEMRSYSPAPGSYSPAPMMRSSSPLPMRSYSPASMRDFSPVPQCSPASTRGHSLIPPRCYSPATLRTYSPSPVPPMEDRPFRERACSRTSLHPNDLYNEAFLSSSPYRAQRSASPAPIDTRSRSPAPIMTRARSPSAPVQAPFMRSPGSPISPARAHASYPPIRPSFSPARSPFSAGPNTPSNWEYTTQFSRRRGCHDHYHDVHDPREVLEEREFYDPRDVHDPHHYHDCRVELRGSHREPRESNGSFPRRDRENSQTSSSYSSYSGGYLRQRENSSTSLAPSFSVASSPPSMTFSAPTSPPSISFTTPPSPPSSIMPSPPVPYTRSPLSPRYQPATSYFPPQSAIHESVNESQYGIDPLTQSSRHEPHERLQSARFACIALSGTNRIRGMSLPPEIRALVSDLLLHGARPGIKDFTELMPGVVEWTIEGHPWSEASEGCRARRIVKYILSTLSSAGWHLVASADLSRKDKEKDTLFFREGLPVDRAFFAVGFSDSDKITIVDPPSDTIRSEFLKTWPRGIQDLGERSGGCTEVKLSGTPWSGCAPDITCQSRILTMKLLAAMDALGYELIASVNLNKARKSDQTIDIDCWIFATKMMTNK